MNLTLHRLAIRRAVLERYRAHRARNVPDPRAENMAVSQTRLYDYPHLSERRIRAELERGIEDDITRGILEGWKA